MSRITRIIFAIALMAIIPLQIKGQQPVTPPSGLPQEKWELTFDDYRAIMVKYYFYIPNCAYPSLPSSYDALINLKKEVVMVRDGNDVYIQGIFSEYGGSWIKGKVNGDRLVITNNQILDTSGPVYFHWGALEHMDIFPHLDENWVRAAAFFPEDTCISFDISEDGKTITSRSQKTHGSALGTHLPSFWFDNDKRGDWWFEYNRFLSFYYIESDKRWYKDTYDDGCGYPDIPYMVNMMFRKI